MAWTDTFTAGALADMGYSGSEIDAWTAADNGTVSGGALNSPSWLDSLLGAAAGVGTAYLKADAAKKTPAKTSSSMLLIIGGAVLLIVALFGGVLLLKK